MSIISKNLESRTGLPDLLALNVGSLSLGGSDSSAGDDPVAPAVGVGLKWSLASTKLSPLPVRVLLLLTDRLLTMLCDVLGRLTTLLAPMTLGC